MTSSVGTVDPLNLVYYKARPLGYNLVYQVSGSPYQI